MDGHVIVTERHRRLPGPPRARAAALLCVALFLTACATAKPRVDPATAPPAAESLLEEARDALRAGEHASAIDALRRIDILHADDPIAPTARLEVVFAHYQAGDQASAIAAAERFARLHPDHPDIDYVFYVRALAHFAEATAELDRRPEGRGVPPTAELALRAFGELVGRFPESRYAGDARGRIRHLEGRLARLELEAAERALNAGEYADAGMRARALLENYPQSGLAREAAVIVNMAHRMLNLRPAAPDAPADGGSGDATPQSPTRPAQAETGGPLREEWIRRQDPAAFTLQLFGTSSEAALLGFIARHGIEPAAYFSIRRNDGPWYALLHGVFGTEDDARAAAERLPAALRGERPWIRRMGDVQALLPVEPARARDPQ